MFAIDITYIMLSAVENKGYVDIRVMFAFLHVNSDLLLFFNNCWSFNTCLIKCVNIYLLILLNIYLVDWSVPIMVSFIIRGVAFTQWRFGVSLWKYNNPYTYVILGTYIIYNTVEEIIELIVRSLDDGDSKLYLPST